MTKNDACNNTEYEQVQVECYSGYKVNERPVAFTFQSHRWEVSDIMDRWYKGGVKPEEPVIDYFKVKTSDGSVFTLQYVVHSDVWYIQR